jgi:hypothetical protein
MKFYETLAVSTGFMAVKQGPWHPGTKADSRLQRYNSWDQWLEQQDEIRLEVILGINYTQKV